MTVSRSRPVLSLFLIAALAGCSPHVAKAPKYTGAGDPLVHPDQVSAAALQGAGLEQRVQAFYAARNFRPAWNPSTAAQLQAAIADLPRHAIDGKRFTEMLAAQDPAGREIALTKAALGYGDVLAHGLIDPSTVFEIAAIDRNTTSVDATLNAALDQGDIRAWVAALPPQDAEYAALSKAYAAYLKAAEAPQPPAIAEGKPIKPGGHDPRVAQIAQALGLTPDADPTLYSKALVEGVKIFQTQQGFNNDGVIGADTLAVLNAGPIDRARQLALNLEARRWLKRELLATRIEVNTAAASLRYYKDGKVADIRRVVAGKPDAETPLLSGGFKQLVVNPPWNVPDGIAQKEILPKGQGYLEANDMYVDNGHVIQRPGPKASLGMVKFDMQNKYAIYLHDTPSKGAFAANERHGSHGCVRVEGALDFARKLADERGVAADFDAKLAKGETAVVSLGALVPVRLAYHTAFLDDAGNIAFRPDVYGWDEKLAAALGLPAPMKRAVAMQAADVGP
jgi:murein L,D-transpeptidase YcbB/YkuD